MIHDRPYMQSPYRPQKLGFLVVFAILCVAVFVVQSLAEVMFSGSAVRRFVYDWLALGIENILNFKIWTLFSYSLLHGGLLHILFNLLIIVMIGTALQRDIGEKAVTMLTIQSIVAGAVGFLLVNFQREDSIVLGASAAAVGILVTYCLLHYERPITFMLFLVLPVTVRAKWILWITVGIDCFLLLTRELPGATAGSSIAHSAHLGGAIAGFLFFRFALGGEFAFGLPSFGKKSTSETWRPKGFRDAAESAPPKSKFSYRPSKQVVNVENKGDFEKEVDRILEKISKDGMGALTADERAVLEKKASTMQRR